jgi:hypothetical protein
MRLFKCLAVAWLQLLSALWQHFPGEYSVPAICFSYAFFVFVEILVASFLMTHL